MLGFLVGNGDVELEVGPADGGDGSIVGEFFGFGSVGGGGERWGFGREGRTSGDRH